MNNKNIKAIKSAKINFQVECEPRDKLSNNYPTQKCKVTSAIVTKFDLLKETTWQDRKDKFGKWCNGTEKLENFHKEVYFSKDEAKACEEVYEADRVKLDVYMKCDSVFDGNKIRDYDWHKDYGTGDRGVRYEDDLHCKVTKADVTLFGTCQSNVYFDNE